ncbi:intermembrane transport protein PqiB [Halomonas sp. 18H]|uniref:intermembrane transport protein PqiB n=1 Tax=Halomonas almeriensis TaxID=308163 RepID=UPI002232A3D2|nr:MULTISPECIES: intermembrane transport protein PqiB [Halomonas]MCW4151770.1 intermembrane transport protein PqiB [Halomonas sp. 18H]MDN3554016.1 intermembrane transport protein PqiB [Halomonas almeriensis]
MNNSPVDNDREDSEHRARASRQAPLSPIWIVPIVALLIGAWLVYDNYASQGPMITLTMDSADGIEAGSTMIKTRNVEVGQIESVSLSDDRSQVVMQARMSEQAEPMLVADTSFWVVKPRIGREGISGLNTVLSGSYLQLEPGRSDEEARSFEVSDQPPVAAPGAEGLRINLTSQVGNALSVGDPITYQGLPVGRVEKADFDIDNQKMQHRVFIESPYHRLITRNTRFWTTSGIDFSLDSQGINIQVESVEALLGGGVTFGVPDDLPQGDPVSSDTHFTLHPDEQSARQGTFDEYLEYVLLIEDTVRGLSKGAPVEFRGVRIGTVASVPWNFTAPQLDGRDRLAIPVLIRIEPQRLGIDNQEMDLEEWEARFKRLFERGLRASLKSGSLLTGALFVDLTFDDQRAGEYTAETFVQHDVFPTTSTGLAQIQSQVTNLLDKLNGLEVEPILTGLDDNLSTSKAMLEEVRQLTTSVDSLVKDPQTRQLPANLNTTLKELQSTLQGLSADSPAYRELTDTLDQVRRLMRDLQPAARKISEDPRALLFDTQEGEDPIPRAPGTRSQP